jgi:very-short-patch-repair endonuclease
MPNEYNRNLIPRAQEMRDNMTPQEPHLWFGFLRNYPVRFRRQSVIYHYIADFYCDKAKLVIEVDGAQHLEPGLMEYDHIRTLTLNQIEITVLRFTNDDIDRRFSQVREKIDQTVKERL